jgi:hypothetical protein
MTDNDSLIKARYALAIVKAAKGSQRAAALKLIEGLALDFPSPETSAAVADAHRTALVKYYELAEGLRSERDAGHLWSPAQRATQKWMDALG